MDTYTYYSYAKINLALEILGKRPDGYHEINSIFLPITLADQIHIQKSDKFDLQVEPHNVKIPLEENIIYKTIKLIQKKYKINIDFINIKLIKNIPIGAGLGGGSSNAATILLALNEIYNLKLSKQELRQIAKEIGADVPFFIDPKPSIVQGIGDIITPIEFNFDFQILLIYPNIQISTKFAYSLIPFSRRPQKSTNYFEVLKQIKSIKDYKKFLVNDFETHLFPHFESLSAIKHKLYDIGAYFATLTGSGASVFGIFESNKKICFDEMIFLNCNAYLTRILF